MVVTLASVYEVIRVHYHIIKQSTVSPDRIYTWNNIVVIILWRTDGHGSDKKFNKEVARLPSCGATTTSHPHRTKLHHAMPYHNAFTTIDLI